MISAHVLRHPLFEICGKDSANFLIGKMNFKFALFVDFILHFWSLAKQMLHLQMLLLLNIVVTFYVSIKIFVFMRRFAIFLFLLAVVSVFCCDVAAQSTRTNIESKTIRLDKAAFLKKVVNFEKSPAVWNYLGDKPAVIDFYADWCGPCRRLAPVLDELAAEYAGKVYVYKVNVDKEKEIAEAFGITSLPTIVFVPVKGNPSAGTGFLPKETLRSAINDLLKEKKK